MNTVSLSPQSHFDTIMDGVGSGPLAQLAEQLTLNQ